MQELGSVHKQQRLLLPGSLGHGGSGVGRHCLATHRMAFYVLTQCFAEEVKARCMLRYLSLLHRSLGGEALAHTACRA